MGEEVRGHGRDERDEGPGGRRHPRRPVRGGARRQLRRAGGEPLRVREPRREGPHQLRGADPHRGRGRPSPGAGDRVRRRATARPGCARISSRKKLDDGFWSALRARLVARRQRRADFFMPRTKGRAVRLGSYARLSRGDDSDGVSGSIVNQQQIIRQYCERSPEDLRIVREYADDGVSGTTYDREGWRALMSDLESGVIEGFVVKDSSRFGRNSIESGLLLEKEFPRMNGGRGVRVIMISEGYDSASSDPYTSSIMLAFRGMLNENVSRDTSVKTRAGLHAKMQRGERACAFAPYGYADDPERRGRLVVDGPAASNVRRIFAMKLDGMSPQAIADELNRLGEPCPGAYKRERGVSLAMPFAGADGPRWRPVTVARILSNEVYAGTMVQGRTYTPSFRSRKTLPHAPEEWFRKEGAHEAIVSLHEFELVQDLMARDTRTAPGSRVVALFSGIAYCAECGQQMLIRTGRNGNRYLTCSTNKRDARRCSSHLFNEARLRAIVAEAAQALVDVSVDTSRFVASHRDELVRERTADVDRRIDDARRRQERALHFRHGLVDDLEAGVITKEEYGLFASAYASRIEEARSAVLELEAERERVADLVTEAEAALERFAASGSIGELTRRKVVELVERVDIHEDKSVEVRFRVQDVMERAGVAFAEGESR
ncbi:hypothetical protein C1872_09855 [Eggerthella lenta]|uniref:Recombinase n=2 Tax=Eggerthellaceae TaxID=1643826 RepID=A0A369MT45_EGGLN|nr:hypothetical protein C1872_09855 [Eggerthella lenta]